MDHASVLHKCTAQVYRTSVSCQCVVQVFCASVLRECTAKVYHRSVLCKCIVQVYCASVLCQCIMQVCCSSVYLQFELFVPRWQVGFCPPPSSTLDGIIRHVRKIWLRCTALGYYQMTSHHRSCPNCWMARKSTQYIWQHKSSVHRVHTMHIVHSYKASGGPSTTDITSQLCLNCWTAKMEHKLCLAAQEQCASCAHIATKVSGGSSTSDSQLQILFGWPGSTRYVWQHKRSVHRVHILQLGIGCTYCFQAPTKCPGAHPQAIADCKYAPHTFA